MGASQTKTKTFNPFQPTQTQSNPIQDLFDLIRPGAERYPTYPAAAAAAESILTQEAAATASGLPPIDEDDDDDDGDRRQSEAASEAASESEAVRGGMDDDDEDEDDDDEEEDEEDSEGLGDYDRGGNEGGRMDEDFEREWQQLMAESGAAAAAAAVGVGVGLGVGPLGVTHHHHGHRAGQWGRAGYDEGGREGEEEEEEGQGAPSVTFKIIMKRGGREDRSKELRVRGAAAPGFCDGGLGAGLLTCGGGGGGAKGVEAHRAGPTPRSPSP